MSKEQLTRTITVVLFPIGLFFPFGITEQCLWHNPFSLYWNITIVTTTVIYLMYNFIRCGDFLGELGDINEEVETNPVYGDHSVLWGVSFFASASTLALYMAGA